MYSQYIAWHTVSHINCENLAVKNITLSIDDETYRLSRIKAAEAGTSVSALVRDYLADLAQGRVPEPRFERLMRLQEGIQDEIDAGGGGLRMADNLPREALHERDALR